MTGGVKEISEKIDQIINDCRDLPHELLYERILFRLLDFKFNFLTTELVKGAKLSRIRINEKTNYPFKNVKDISYPPPNLLTKFNRVNRPGQSMLYCSEHVGLSEIELLYDYIANNSIGHKRYATYSEWVTQKDLKLLVLALAKPSCEYVNMLTLRAEFETYINSRGKDEQQSIRDQYEMAANYFHKSAKSDSSVYVVTTAIANLASLYWTVDGFVYPSVQNGVGYNIVLRPHVVDQALIIPQKEMQMKKWHISDANIMTVDPKSRTGLINDNKIVWDCSLKKYF